LADAENIFLGFEPDSSWFSIKFNGRLVHLILLFPIYLNFTLETKKNINTCGGFLEL